jgi:hypothetical protein
MEDAGRAGRRGIGQVICGAVALAVAVLAPSLTAADPFGAGDGTISRLTSETNIQEVCFAPCLCPIMITEGVRGTFVLS